jgi:hypothetical protein
MLLLLGLPLAAAARPADPASIIVYGERHAFTVDVPVGWRQDGEALKDQGVRALFYRANTAFRNAPVVLYVNTAEADPAGLDAFVAGDLDGFRRGSPALVVTPQPPIATARGRVVRLFRLEHVRGGGAQLVGYLGEDDATVVFVASARTPAALDREAATFTALVRSYAFVTDDVQVDAAR